MKKNIISFCAILVALFAQGASAATNYLWISDEKLRTGNISFDDIPTVIISVTNFLLGFVGSLSVVCIIYGAFRIVLGSVPGDKDSGKKIITGAIIGFVVSVSGWLVINTLITNL